MFSMVVGLSVFFLMAFTADSIGIDRFAISGVSGVLSYIASYKIMNYKIAAVEEELKKKADNAVVVATVQRLDDAVDRLEQALDRLDYRP